MPTTVFDDPAPSSGTSDYAPEGAFDSDDAQSDQDEGIPTLRLPSQGEVSNGLSLRKKASAERVKDAWDHEPLSGQYDRATEVAPRMLACRWQSCQSKLASLALLEKHLRKKHVESSDLAPAASSSRGAKKFVCRYGTCANRWFATRNDLMAHVVDNHTEQLRLTCPVKACRRVNTTQSALRRHLHTVHATEPEFAAVLESFVDAPHSATGVDVPTFPTLLVPASSIVVAPLPPCPSNLPTYLAFLPRLRPALSDPTRQKIVDDGNDFDPYFMEFFEEDEPLKPRHRLQLSRRPIQSLQNLERVKKLDKVQLSPSRRLRRTQSVVSSVETSPGPDESLEVAFTVTRRIRGTILYLPPRELPPPPDLSRVSWREFKAPVGPELEPAATDVGTSSRAPSVATLAATSSSREPSVDAPVVKRRKISTAPSSPSVIPLPSLPSVTLAEITARTQTGSQSTASTAAGASSTNSGLPPTIGFNALSTWRKGFEHAVEMGVMEKDSDPFLPKPVKGRPRKERVKKRGRAPKRARVE